jgi:hypothetical protein
VLVIIRPLNGVAVAKQLPIPSLDFGSVLQARIPCEGHAEAATVSEIDVQMACGYFNAGGDRFVFKLQSIHARRPEEFADVLEPAFRSLAVRVPDSRDYSHTPLDQAKSFAICRSCLIWMCGGSPRSELKETKLYGPSRRTVGISLPSKPIMGANRDGGHCSNKNRELSLPVCD